MLRALKERFGVDIALRACLACDISPACQRHIRGMGETEILLADVAEIPKRQGVNLLDGKMASIPECDLLVAGTSCVNLSSMHLES